MRAEIIRKSMQKVVPKRGPDHTHNCFSPYIVDGIVLFLKSS